MVELEQEFGAYEIMPKSGIRESVPKGYNTSYVSYPHHMGVHIPTVEF